MPDHSTGLGQSSATVLCSVFEGEDVDPTICWTVRTETSCAIDQVLQRPISFAKRLGNSSVYSNWPGRGHWDLRGDERLENVGVAAAQAWGVLAMIAVHTKEIENEKMVLVERIVDEVSLLHFGQLRWVPWKHDARRWALPMSLVAVGERCQCLE